MQPQNQNAQHVSTSTYWKVGGILAVLTALEVAVVYIESLKDYLAFLLLLMGVIKFILVAMYFMHLKFDSPIYSRFFMVGLGMAVIIMLSVIAIINSDRVATALLMR